MSRLTKAQRKALPSKDFAGPNRTFEINDRNHAKAAIMDSGSAPAKDRAKIKRKAERYLKTHPAKKKKK